MHPSSKSAATPFDFDASVIKAWALRYLGRYDTTAEGLRRYLLRKIQRIAQGVEADLSLAPDRAEMTQRVENVIERLKELQLIDDERYMAGRLAGLKRKGLSSARIKIDLQRKGIKDIDPLHFADLNPEEQARIFAARKKLGPFRSQERTGLRQNMRDKDIANLVRNGFPYAIAKAVIDAKD
jgi:regulatory protein